MTVTLGPATEAHLPAVVAIVNHAIATTDAIWREEPVDLEDRRAWLASRWAALVAVDDVGEVLGFSAVGAFRSFSGFAATGEHSVFVAEGAQGRGIGSLLLGGIVDAARDLGLHVLVGAIEAGNTASLALHARHGFVEVGRMPEVGRHRGRWLDLVLVQRIVAAPVA